MFNIYRFLYISRGTHLKHVIFARNVEFADKLAKRITDLGVFNLRRARIGFCKLMVTDTPPYELEMEQLATIEGWEKHIIS